MRAGAAPVPPPTLRDSTPKAESVSVIAPFAALQLKLRNYYRLSTAQRDKIVSYSAVLSTRIESEPERERFAKALLANSTPHVALQRRHARATSSEAAETTSATEQAVAV